MSKVQQTSTAGAFVAALAMVALAGCIDAPTSPQGCGHNQHGTPDFCGADTWVQGGPLTLEGLEGKVVMVDFWTYSCINCIRVMPHVTAWYDTYSDHGFVVLGVHAPEFEFEKEDNNVVRAIDDFGIHYPVVKDDDHLIWKNYENRYWPAHYFIDHQGKIVHHHFGEGNYDETEQVIRDLLLDAGAKDLPPAIEPTWDPGQRGDGITPELYAGTWRQEWTLGNPEGYHPGDDVAYETGGAVRSDRIYLNGTWYNGREYLESREAGTIWLKFRAGAVNVVLAPSQEGACLPVYIDDAIVKPENRPNDVELRGAHTCIDVDRADSFDLWHGSVETHVLRIDVVPGTRLYTFAFSHYDQM